MTIFSFIRKHGATFFALAVIGWCVLIGFGDLAISLIPENWLQNPASEESGPEPAAGCIEVDGITICD